MSFGGEKNPGAAERRERERDRGRERIREKENRAQDIAQENTSPLRRNRRG